MKRLFTLTAAMLLCTTAVLAADEVYNVNVKITWNDNANAEGYRPSSVALAFVQVQDDGTTVDMPQMACTLTADTNWEFLIGEVAPAKYRVTENTEGYQLQNDTYIFMQISQGEAKRILWALPTEAEQEDPGIDLSPDPDEEGEDDGPVTVQLTLVMDRDGTTPSAIELSRVTDEQPAVYHTLGGQRIDRPVAPGIYIRDGRKIVVK